MAVDTSEWDGSAAMSACASSDDPAAAYRAICAGRREGDPDVQSSWALPHHKSPGAGPNAAGVRNALSRLPQTEGLTNRDAAEAHLEAHMAEINPETRDAFKVDVASDVQVRDAVKRELDVRLMRWNETIDTIEGREVFEPGAFAGTNPNKVWLMGPEHEVRIGYGQAGLRAIRVPAGKGISIEERDDAPYMTFRVSKTQAGDEILALAEDGIVTGVSIEFNEVPGGTAIETRNGRRTKVHRRVQLSGLSTTYQPAYGEQAAVVAVRSQAEEEAPVAEPTPEVTEPTKAPETPAPAPDVRVLETLERIEKRNSDTSEKFLERLLKVEETQRKDIAIPAGASAVEAQHNARVGEWFQTALRVLSGESIPETQKRVLADLITTDNIGVVPPTYSTELIGVIDPRRPFMQTTRRLATPDSGMQLIMPRIKTRPTVGIQDYEKQELTSTATAVDTVSFDAVTKGGAGDISLQLLKRSSPSFLELYLQLLGEAYAIDSEHEAVEALIDLVGDYGGVASGGVLDPEDLALGSAWTTGFNAIRRPPDTIWLSSAGVAAFIDAKSPISNAPLYSQLSANFTTGGGVGGSISGLRAVHVPALDDQGYDALVGPSTGFAWAEDGTYTLQVDVPGKAGRDVALVGILWFCPIYPSAFTAYTIAS